MTFLLGVNGQNNSYDFRSLIFKCCSETWVDFMIMYMSQNQNYINKPSSLR